MSALAIYLSIAALCVLIINTESAVIKMQEIKLNKDLVMKIVVKQGNDGDSVATIKIATDGERKHDKGLMPKLIDKFVKPTGDFVPDFEDRHGILSGSCPTGQVRRGPICV